MKDTDKPWWLTPHGVITVMDWFGLTREQAHRLIASWVHDHLLTNTGRTMARVLGAVASAARCSAWRSGSRPWRPRRDTRRRTLGPRRADSLLYRSVYGQHPLPMLGSGPLHRVTGINTTGQESYEKAVGASGRACRWHDLRLPSVRETQRTRSVGSVSMSSTTSRSNGTSPTPTPVSVDWHRGDVGLVPNDASQIVRTARTDDQVELVTLRSSSRVFRGGCTALRGSDRPEMNTIDVPEPPSQVYACDGWHVFYDDEGRWFGWPDSETLQSRS